MTGDPRADVTLLDELEAARAAGATEGDWEAQRFFWKLGSTRGLPDGWWRRICDDAGTVALLSEQDDEEDGDTAASRAALIVAAVNALPQLIAAVRAGLALADEREADGRRLAAHPDPFEAGRGDMALITASRLRHALTAPLGHGGTEEEIRRG